jgi:exosortase
MAIAHVAQGCRYGTAQCLLPFLSVLSRRNEAGTMMNPPRAVSFRVVSLSLLIGGSIVWAYVPVILGMTGKWFHTPQYSHAFLVPAFSIYLLWRSRAGLSLSTTGPSWIGLLPLLLGVSLRLLGAYFYVSWLEMMSLLPVLWGVALLLGGKPALHASWVAIGFLVFMFPLPYRVETGLSDPLQQAATRTSEYVFQLLGFAAFRERNVIIVHDHRIGVVEACNGLGMLHLFFALATAMVLLSRRPREDRVVLLLCAVPIAILSNVIRIVITGVLYGVAGQRWGDLVFHDLSGWLMMPLALGLLWLALKVLTFLLVESPVEEGLSLESFVMTKNSTLQHARG